MCLIIDSVSPRVKLEGQLKDGSVTSMAVWTIEVPCTRDTHDRNETRVMCGVIRGNDYEQEANFSLYQSLYSNEC